MVDLFNDLSSLLLGVSVASLAVLVAILYNMLPDEDRSFMDPIPPAMKLIWPVVRIIAYFLGTSLPLTVLERIETRLQDTGGCYLFSAEEFFGLSTVSALVFALIGFFVVASISGMGAWVIVLAFLMGFSLPFAWLSDSRKRRDKELIRTLPMYLEFLSMCVDAGLNFSGALKQAIDKGPQGAMRNEFRIVLRDIRSGLSRGDALRRMELRIRQREISVFVSAVVQAERMGSSMKNTLKIQAQQRLNERFQRAEKQAMEAPVKLVVPLVLFIFPLTFIILLFPIVVRFLSEGGM